MASFGYVASFCNIARNEIILLLWMGAFMVLGRGVHNTAADNLIESEYEDIFDCVDVNQQPALDHPLLKNHKIQMIPSSYPKELSVTPTPFKIQLSNGECPSGFIPILRTPEDVLSRPKLLPIYHENYSPKSLFDNSPKVAYQMAIHLSLDDYYGATSNLNVYGVRDININQMSSSGLWIANTNGQLSAVQAGWMANPSLFGDGKTRFYTYWTANYQHGQGCYNLLCPGFVQVDRSIGIGAAIWPTSNVGGNQYEIRIQIFREPNNGNWWLVFGDKNVGYWPKELFNNDLANHASEIRMGGLVGYVDGMQGPAMGNGHFHSKGFQKDPIPCYVAGIKTFNKHNETHELEFGHADPYTSKIECYHVSDLFNARFYFGGPAGCT